MTGQECMERNCPLYDDDIGCLALNSEGLNLNDVESCVGMTVVVEATE